MNLVVLEVLITHVTRSGKTYNAILHVGVDEGNNSLALIHYFQVLHTVTVKSNINTTFFGI